jgi:glutathione synthase/RimK-type ligase-like ATP-grasp enzyme
MNLDIATCQRLLPSFHDDAPLFEALKGRSLDARGVAWQDIDGTEPVLVRSPWDYTLDMPGFTAWFDRLDAAGALCMNPTRLMRWNIDKRYLLELEAAGHAIVPTRVLPAFEPAAMADIANAECWAAAIAKPVTGAGAEGLVVLDGNTTQSFDASGLAWGDDWPTAPTGACLIQPRLDSIQKGEWSLIYIGGQYSHAVLKLPKPGDIRVQEEHGATSHAAVPPKLVRAAADAIMADQPDAVFARVDGVDDPTLGFVLMELELIEPELFFRYHPPAIERMADEIAARLRA